MGQCIDGDDHLLVTEFAELGSLSFETWEETIAPAHNIAAMRQIAEGMKHLVSNGVVHRDLAARNVLVFAFGLQDVRKTSLKITDDGLATNICNRGYVTVRHETRPIRYMSEEALEKDRFSESSDVWASGNPARSASHWASFPTSNAKISN